ncbi:MAG: motility protein A [Nitrospinae bacterium]|nr:motility protein A [Nitrospinota bacterium]
MDIGTAIGFLCGVGLLAWAMNSGAGGIMGFYDLPSVLIVFGGTASAVFVMFPMGDVFKTFSIGMKTFFHKAPNPADTITVLMDLALLARKDGLLALEKKIPEDPFLAKGVRLVVDGIDQNSIRALMEIEVSAIQGRHAHGAELFNQIATLAPAFGMIGTLVGLVQMLKSLSDPSSIGPAMAVAMITTFYGALIANMVCLPMSKKLTFRSAEETGVMEMAIEGIISVAKKENPNLMKAKLNAYLAPKLRVE